MIYVYSLHLALSHVLDVLSSLNYVSVSPITISLFLHFYYFFPPYSTVLFAFKSEISIHFVLGTTVSYFLPCCVIIYFAEVILLVCWVYFDIYKVFLYNF